MRALVLESMTGAAMMKNLAKIIQYERQRSFGVQALQCDKGSNLDCGIVKETMAQLGIGHEPLPTGKHDGPVEACIRPLREEVMTTLRLIAARWGTTPPRAWLSGVLTQAGVMHDYRTYMLGDDETVGVRLHGRKLDAREVIMEPGTPGMVKVPPKGTKHDLRSKFYVYLATRASAAMTCVAYNMSSNKLDEIAIHDIEPVKLTQELKDIIKKISDEEAAAGQGLQIGDMTLLKSIIRKDDNPVRGGEGGGDAEASDTAPPSTRVPEQQPVGDDGHDPPESFVTDIQVAKAGLSARIETLLHGVRHPPMDNMNVTKEEKSKLLRAVIRMHAAIRMKKSKVEEVYSMSIQEAEELFPDLAEGSIQTELNNIFAKAFVPVDWKKLRKMNKRYLIKGKTLIDPKLDAQGMMKSLKTRIVGLGCQQRREEVGETSSPTISFTALLIRESIALQRGEICLVTDVTAAYLNAAQPETDAPVYLCLDKGTSAAAIRSRPEFAKYLDENKQLVGILKFALYGTLAARYLWYTTLTAALHELGYQPNPYEPCLFNRMEGGVQCSVCIYVDDLRWYSLNKEYLMADIAHLNKKFGVTKKLTLQDGNITEYLGMIWDRSALGECRITSPKRDQAAARHGGGDADEGHSRR